MALIDNLVSYWKLDESSTGVGAVTRNDSHSTNHLTDNNTTPSGTGKISNGASYNKANSEYLSRADTAALRPSGSMSISLWIKRASTNSSMEFISMKDPSSNYLIEWSTTRILWRRQTSAGSQDATYTVSPDTTNWYHIVMTYDESATTLLGYLNGTQVATKTTTGTGNSTAGQFELGRLATNAINYVDGVMDEVGLWSRALTAAEVTSLYNGGSGLAYPFTTSSVNSGFLMFM